MAGEILGAVTVGDTILFQDSRRQEHRREKSTIENFIVLTEKDFDYVKVWVAMGREADFAAHVNNVLLSEYMVRIHVIYIYIGEREEHDRIHTTHE